MATVVLGICGSIAAYKAADVASRLTKAGHDVHCVCTPTALRFVTPLTLVTLSHHPVISSFDEETVDWIPAHIALAQKADVLAIVPASAHTIACFAQGLAPNVLIFPAMNSLMWDHPATQKNVQTVITRGNYVIGPEEGDLACGTHGKGRLVDVDTIVSHIQRVL